MIGESHRDVRMGWKRASGQCDHARWPRWRQRGHHGHELPGRVERVKEEADGMERSGSHCRG